MENNYENILEIDVKESKIYLKTLFYLFSNEFDKMEIFKILEEKIQFKQKENNNIITEESKEDNLLKEINIARQRIQYFTHMVLDKEEFLSLEENESWKPLSTCQDYFNAIQYLKLEYKRIIQFVSDHLYAKPR